MASGRGSLPGRRACPRCLNSCSGEVWPRGRALVEERARAIVVSILVLVKYGLGVRTAGPPSALLPLVSILVLVKYGLGVATGRPRHRERADRVSILVLVKYGLGGPRH